MDCHLSIAAESRLENGQMETIDAIYAERSEKPTVDDTPDSCSDRRSELLEEFVSLCQRRFSRKSAKKLRDRIGVRSQTASQKREPLLGIYPTALEVREHLESRGFTSEEITRSCVCGDQRLTGRLVVPWRDRNGKLETIVAIETCATETQEPRELYLRGASRPEFFGLDKIAAHDDQIKDVFMADDVLTAALFQANGFSEVVALAPSPGLTENEYVDLARLSVERLTLVISPDRSVDEVLSHTLMEYHKAAQAPELWIAQLDALSKNKPVKADENQSPRDRIASWAAERRHCYSLCAEMIVHEVKQSAPNDDSALLGIIDAAVRLDGTARQARHQVELNRHFWPTLLNLLGTDWRSLTVQLGNRWETVRRDLARHDQLRKYTQIVHELASALQANAFGKFQRIIIEMYHSLGGSNSLWEAPADRTMDDSDPANEIAAPSISGKGKKLSQARADDWESRFHEFETSENLSSFAEFTPKRTTVRQFRRFNVPTIAETRALAYQLWDKAGRPTGRDEYFWYEAERRLQSSRRVA